VLETLAELVISRGPAPQVLVHGPGSEAVAEELSRYLDTIGHVPRRRRLARTDTVLVRAKNAAATAAGRWPATPEWDIVVQVRDSGRPEGPADHPDHPPDVVVDTRDPDRPVIRHVSVDLPLSDVARVREIQAFFGARAAGWDAKFGDDIPAYTAAAHEAGYAPGAIVADIGCGTGRALPALRAAVGEAGAVLAVEVTLEMLEQVRATGRDVEVSLILGDALHLPLATGSLGGIFAAGLVNHWPEPVAGLTELARVTASGGRLAMFHPTGRAALAARHGRVVGPDEPLSPGRLGDALAASGWRLDTYDDAPERFLAVAERS
jgi:SAM-dependent methyltransferase